MQSINLRDANPAYKLILVVLAGVALACFSGENGEGDGAEGFIEISTAEELQGIGSGDPNSSYENYILVNDIDMSHVEDYEPFRFSGILEGDGYTISGLTIEKSIDDQDAEKIGLFAELSGSAEVRNLTVENASVSGFQHVGVITGMMSNSRIENVRVVNSTVTGNSRVGGAVGFSGRGTAENDGIEGVVVEGGTVSGSNMVGGLIGSNSISIVDSMATNDVRGGFDVGEVPAPDLDALGIGGFAGIHSSDEIKQSEAHGEVQVGGENFRFVGGFVGRVQGGGAEDVTISDCAAHGDVVVQGAGGEVGLEGFGGFAGDNFGEDAIITRSFSRGAVHFADGPDDVVGAFVGSVTGDAGVTVSVYDSDTVGAAELEEQGEGDASDASQSDVSPMATSAMQSAENFPGEWDFDTVWDVDGSTAGGYPFIRGLH